MSEHDQGGDQDRSLWQQLFKEIDYENPELSESGSKFVARSDPDRPPHPGGDLVQCRNCGAYWNADNPFEVLVPAEKCALREGSVALCSQIRTISIDHRITEPLGSVPQERMDEVDTALEYSLGLTEI